MAPDYDTQTLRPHRGFKIGIGCQQYVGLVCASQRNEQRIVDIVVFAGAHFVGVEECLTVS